MAAVEIGENEQRIADVVGMADNGECVAVAARDDFEPSWSGE